MSWPVKNAAFTFYVALVDTAARPAFKVNPTLAAGDVKVSIDGGAFNNLGTLPDAEPDAGRAIRVIMAQAEMNGDDIVVQFVDAAGAEWDDLIVHIHTTARGIDSLATQTSVDDLPTNAELATALAAADDAVLAAMAALNNLSAAQVNAEVVDALATDTYAEPTGVPAATATLAVKIGRLHQALRNQVTVTATKKQFFDDSAAALWEKDLSDDGTTYQETEGNAP